jgi:metal-responsive CopG/Arc/MetJ family transcriptional regulator
MKTAISLPDKLYNEAEKTAKTMGIPRSQLFAIALEEYLNKVSKNGITSKLNEIYKNINVKQDNTSIEAMRRLTQNDAW